MMRTSPVKPLVEGAKEDIGEAVAGTPLRKFTQTIKAIAKTSGNDEKTMERLFGELSKVFEDKIQGLTVKQAKPSVAASRAKGSTAKTTTVSPKATLKRTRENFNGSKPTSRKATEVVAGAKVSSSFLFHMRFALVRWIIF